MAPVDIPGWWIYDWGRLGPLLWLHIWKTKSDCPFSVTEFGVYENMLISFGEICWRLQRSTLCSIGG
jgi:hypothetical protein